MTRLHADPAAQEWVSPTGQRTPFAGSGGGGYTSPAISDYLITTAAALERAIINAPTPTSGRYYDLTTGTDETFDARGQSFASMVTQNSHTYVLRLGNAIGDFDRPVWVGGYATTDVPEETLWHSLKVDRDGAGIMARAGEYLVIDGLRIRNVMDGIRPQVALENNLAAYSIRNVWAEYVRDDFVEPDATGSGGEVRDCLIDGAFMFYSFQGSVNNGDEPLVISHCLVRLAPMPYTTDVGGSAPSRESTYGVGADRHGQLFKHYSAGVDPDIVCTDTLFFVEQHSVNPDSAMDFPPGTYTNCTLIWIGDTTNPAAYPATVRAGITEYNLLTHTEAELRAMWADAKAAWKTRHGFAADAAITDTPAFPAKLIAPDGF